MDQYLVLCAFNIKKLKKHLLETSVYYRAEYLNIHLNYRTPDLVIFR